MAQFITDAQLTTALEACLKVTAGALASTTWPAIVTASNLSAYQEIVGALTERGYTLTQIATWDRGGEFETDIGLFWCLTKGAGLHGNDPTFIFKLDRRAELKDVPVLLAGLEAAPGTVVGFGVLDTTCDRFTKHTHW